jgi:hypothetical protein
MIFAISPPSYDSSSWSTSTATAMAPCQRAARLQLFVWQGIAQGPGLYVVMSAQGVFFHLADRLRRGTFASSEMAEIIEIDDLAFSGSWISWICFIAKLDELARFRSFCW